MINTRYIYIELVHKTPQMIKKNIHFPRSKEILRWGVHKDSYLAVRYLDSNVMYYIKNEKIYHGSLETWRPNWIW